MSLTNTFTTVAISVLFLAGVSLSAVASGSLFYALDTDQSGTISKLEAKSHSDLEVLFDQVDVDNDGEITAAEFVAAGLEE